MKLKMRGTDTVHTNIACIEGPSNGLRVWALQGAFQEAHFCVVSRVGFLDIVRDTCH